MTIVYELTLYKEGYGGMTTANQRRILVQCWTATHKEVEHVNTRCTPL